MAAKMATDFIENNYNTSNKLLQHASCLFRGSNVNNRIKEV